MTDRFTFYYNRLKERLWIRPLLYCILSVISVFLAKMMDHTELAKYVPIVDSDTIETLLTTISASMLVISTFAVASMVSAYAAASTTATPRSFTIIVADDVSQNALSAFIAAFIFSIVALIALKNSFYDRTGNFTLFIMMLLVFTIVILTFLRWVDRIARLGRLGTTIERVEATAAAALTARKIAPTLGGALHKHRKNPGHKVFSETIGYVQHIDMKMLQKYASELNIKIVIASLPGTFVSPGRAIAFTINDQIGMPVIDSNRISEAFIIGRDRVFDEDPRFGLITLSEIASRALSPAINDPGTAISIIDAFVRLFNLWAEPIKEGGGHIIEFDRVEVPLLSLYDMFDDAFTPIARDGAGAIEVALRLQKAFSSLACIGDPILKEVSIHHAKVALKRAEYALVLPYEKAKLKEVSILPNQYPI